MKKGKAKRIFAVRIWLLLILSMTGFKHQINMEKTSMMQAAAMEKGNVNKNDDSSNSKKNSDSDSSSSKKNSDSDSSSSKKNNDSDSSSSSKSDISEKSIPRENYNNKNKEIEIEIEDDCNDCLKIGAFRNDIDLEVTRQNLANLQPEESLYIGQLITNSIVDYMEKINYQYYEMASNLMDALHFTESNYDVEIETGEKLTPKIHFWGVSAIWKIMETLDNTYKKYINDQSSKNLNKLLKQVSEIIDIMKKAETQNTKEIERTRALLKSINYFNKKIVISRAKTLMNKYTKLLNEKDNLQETEKIFAKNQEELEKAAADESKNNPLIKKTIKIMNQTISTVEGFEEEVKNLKEYLNNKEIKGEESEQIRILLEDQAKRTNLLREELTTIAQPEKEQLMQLCLEVEKAEDKEGRSEQAIKKEYEEMNVHDLLQILIASLTPKIKEYKQLLKVQELAKTKIEKYKNNIAILEKKNKDLYNAWTFLYENMKEIRDALENGKKNEKINPSNIKARVLRLKKDYDELVKQAKNGTLDNGAKNNDELNEKAVELKKLTDEKNQLKNENLKLQKQNENMKLELKNNKSTIDNYQQEKNNYEVYKTNMLNQIQELTVAKTDLTTRLKDAEQRAQSQLKEARTALEKANKVANDNKTEYEKQIAQIQKDNEVLKQENEQQKEDINNLEKIKNNMQKENKNLKDKLANDNQIYEQLVKDHNNLQEENKKAKINDYIIQELRKTNEEKEAKILTLGDENKQLQEKNELLKEEKTNLENEINKMKSNPEVSAMSIEKINNITLKGKEKTANATQSNINFSIAGQKKEFKTSTLSSKKESIEIPAVKGSDKEKKGFMIEKNNVSNFEIKGKENSEVKNPEIEGKKETNFEIEREEINLKGQKKGFLADKLEIGNKKEINFEGQKKEILFEIDNNSKFEIKGDKDIKKKEANYEINSSELGIPGVSLENQEKENKKEIARLDEMKKKLIEEVDNLNEKIKKLKNEEISLKTKFEQEKLAIENLNKEFTFEGQKKGFKNLIISSAKKPDENLEIKGLNNEKENSERVIDKDLSFEIVGQEKPDNEEQTQEEFEIVGQEKPENEEQTQEELTIEGQTKPENEEQTQEELTIEGQTKPENEEQFQEELTIEGQIKPENEEQTQEELTIEGQTKPENEEQTQEEFEIVGQEKPENEEQTQEEFEIVGQTKPENEEQTQEEFEIVGQIKPENEEQLQEEFEIVGQEKSENGTQTEKDNIIHEGERFLIVGQKKPEVKKLDFKQNKEINIAIEGQKKLEKENPSEQHKEATELQKKVDELNNKILNLQSENEKLKKTNKSDFNLNVNRLANENLNLKTQNNKLQEENKDLNNQLKIEEKRIEEFGKYERMMTQKYAVLQRVLDTYKFRAEEYVELKRTMVNDGMRLLGLSASRLENASAIGLYRIIVEELDGNARLRREGMLNMRNIGVMPEKELLRFRQEIELNRYTTKNQNKGEPNKNMEKMQQLINRGTSNLQNPLRFFKDDERQQTREQQLKDLKSTKRIESGNTVKMRRYPKKNKH